MPSVRRHAVGGKVREVFKHVIPFREFHAAVFPPFANQGTVTYRRVRDGTHGEFFHGGNAERIQMRAPNREFTGTRNDVEE